ncbi:thiamine biosynthesis protein ApbE [Solemya pervernicosa gill symbiont]|uniref:FAD:protein FMN transferase n=2 Tax=Gammaproteobacteria incertae sedis TaxID=118884 RepID=A0A1T2L067_9GAMM|nr:FAD:protein FMN transferase [Candidatus Reidiella endopervernicosa]OOZ38507.1 thiamine biosynthesis protein ApbE [Solemya pervernicosa gill symbiont]QKQ26801.1 FAD:protein FMN transferase [Candidatus Reidiella endopervernicosa]
MQINKLITALLLLTLSLSATAEWHRDEQPIMGTLIRVELWHSDSTLGKAAVAAVFEEMHRIDHLMSPYKEQSELSRVNREAANQPVVISSELYQLIERANEVSELSNGSFDITFASVGHLYDYRNQINPSADTIEAQLNTIDYRHLILNPMQQSISYTRHGVRIDLGGIAKGHAVDRSIALLKRRGISQALVSAGGDTRILGNKQGRPWMTGIRDPRNPGRSEVVVPLSNAAISTSGDYERYFEKDGIRHHHIISPSTGRSVDELRSVSIISANATTTDALSTTVFVLGLKAGMKLVEASPDLEAIIIDNQGKMHYSSGLGTPQR